MRRQNDQQSAQQADQIVVIEIGRLVDQLDVGEAGEKQRDARRDSESRARRARRQDGERREQADASAPPAAACTHGNSSHVK